MGKGQLYGLAGGGRLIDGQDHLQGIAAGHGIHIGLTVMLDGVHHVGKEAGMAVAVDIAGGLLKSLILLVVLGLIGKVPDINVIVI